MSTPVSGAGSRRKGARTELDVIHWLHHNGFPHAERRLAGGDRDTGDVTGIGPIVLEVKNQARLDLAAWLDQLATEMDEAGVDVGAVVHKRRGTTDVGAWYATMPAAVLAVLLSEAGYTYAPVKETS